MNQISNKIQIPIKIKIAAWVLIIRLILEICFTLWVSIYYYWAELASQLPYILIGPFLAILLYSLTAYWLLGGKRKGWYLGVGYLALAVVQAFVSKPWHGLFALGFIPMFFTLIDFLVLIELVVDRKCYFAAIENTKNKSAQNQ